MADSQASLIRVADHRVYAGRTLHEAEVDGDGEWQSVQLESETWGLKGKVDSLFAVSLFRCFAAV